MEIYPQHDEVIIDQKTCEDSKLTSAELSAAFIRLQLAHNPHSLQSTLHTYFCVCVHIHTQLQNKSPFLYSKYLLLNLHVNLS